MADVSPAGHNRSRPLLPSDGRPGQWARVPAPLSSIIGRESEAAAVLRLLHSEDIRVVTLTGPGGVGKSRLALFVAEQAGPTFAGGICFVDLSPLTEPALVLPSLAKAFRVRDTDADTLAQGLAATVADRELLLVVDNVEHVLDAVPALTALLAACPRAKLLATSRTRLRVSGEHVVEVPPLALPDERVGQSVDTVVGAEAVRLFVARAEALSRDFLLTPEVAPVVGEICRRLDGLPLAIELAAAWLAHLPPVVLLERLEPRLPLLTGGPRDAPARHRTMRDALAWSYELLPLSQQRLFQQLSVFVGGFDLDSAQAMAGDGLDVLPGIAALAEASLLHQVPSPGHAPRYVLLETVREFARERLVAAGEEVRMCDRHAAWCLAMAEQGFAGLVLGPSLDLGWLDRLEAEHGNLRAALAWLADRGDRDAFPQLAGALGPFWFFRSYVGESRFWLERALVCAGRVESPCRARLLMSLGTLLQVGGDPERAGVLVAEAMDLWEAAGEMALANQALLILGWMAVKAGAYDRGAAQLDRAGAQFRSMGANWWIAKAVFHQGEAALGSGRLGEARVLFAEAHDRYTVLADPWGVASSFQGLGAVACDQADRAEAARCYRAGLAPWRAVGSTEGLLSWLAGVGNLAWACGQPAVAAQLFGATAALGRAHGLTFGLPETARIAQAVSRIRAALGDEASTAETAAGQDLSIEQAVAAAVALLDQVEATPETENEAATVASLTHREHEVLRHLATGATDREIAAELSISPRTVGVHVSHLLAKLGVETRRAARARALRERLV